MGVRMSKISYKMSEVEQKLGCINDEENTDKEDVNGVVHLPQIAGDDDAADAASSLALNVGPDTVTVTTNSSVNHYQSNSSLSSGNGDVSCVPRFSWTKSATDKLSRRRKVKSTPPPKTELPGFIKSSKKNLLKGIGSSKKKSEPIASTSRAVTASSGNNAPVPGTSCVCTSHRRTNSEPQEQRQLVPGCSITVILDPMSLEHRLSATHVLGVFNPEDYPIEDEDEKMRRQRAKEMSEGVELSEKFGILSFSKGSYQPAAHSQIDYIHVLVPDLKEITSCSFYWGKIDRYAAEKLLEDKPEGTFLLRDSAQEEYLFSVSFRRYGRSLHARIEQWGHAFSFDAHDPSVYSAPTVTGLIEHYKDPSYCMFFEPMLTVRLHRNFTFSLQHLARSVICNSNTYDSISYLPLPKTLKEYCREYHYKQRVRVRNFPES